jgi:uncharacterized protein
MRIEENFDFHPWYKKGVRFHCTQCGKCCTGKPGFVWVSEQEIEQIAAYLGISDAECKIRYLKKREGKYCLIDKKSANWDCIFLKDKLCTIHPVRPKQCQSYPWWPEHLKSEESWSIIENECEGANPSAPLIAYGEIEANLKITQDEEGF